jgi:hypothetical protein
MKELGGFLVWLNRCTGCGASGRGRLAFQEEMMASGPGSFGAARVRPATATAISDLLSSTGACDEN